MIVEVEGWLLFGHSEHAVVHSADADVCVAISEIFASYESWDGVAANPIGFVFAVDVPDVVIKDPMASVSVFLGVLPDKIADRDAA